MIIESSNSLDWRGLWQPSGYDPCRVIKTRLLWGKHPIKVLNISEDGDSAASASKHLPVV